MLPRLVLEELHATLAQGDGHLYALVPKYKVLWTGKKVRNDLYVSERFVCVPISLAHKLAFLCANSQLHRCG